MSYLNLYLLSGLILHKVIWEVLRKRADISPKENQSFSLRAVKAVKVGILLGIIAQTLLPFDLLPIAEDSFNLRITGTIIYTFGLLTAIAARFQLGENWADIETGKVLQSQKVVAQGIYGFIRHPIYTGDLFLLLGLELALNSWLVLGLLILGPVVMIKAIKEEEKLVHELPGYDAYQARTKRFIPFLV